MHLRERELKMTESFSEESKVLDPGNIILESRDIRKIFHGKNRKIVALDGVDLAVRKKGIFAITGKSGAGKSVVLGILGGLDRPSSGSVLFEGRPLEQLSKSELSFLRREKMGFIFQSYNLIPSWSAFENVEVALLNQGMPRKLRREKVEKLLTEFGLEDRFDSLPSELSMGQQQRVAIARALANEPSLILADEPTGDLDPTTGQEIISYLTRLVRERGVTLVIATQGNFPLEAANQVVYLRNGRLSSEKEAFT
jgi:putative ABC transport system ATP-binding protein